MSIEFNRNRKVLLQYDSVGEIPSGTKTGAFANVGGVLYHNSASGWVVWNGTVADGAITIAKLAAGVLAASVAGRAKMADGFFDEATATLKFAAGAITTALLKDLAVTTDKLAADAVTGAKLADDAVNSEHIADGAIDAAHLAPGVAAKQDAGTVASASLLMAQQPTTLDTIAIGADTYQFVTAAGAVNNNAFIGVPIGVNAAATRANLIAAINNTAGPTGLTLIDTVTPALSGGTENLLADEISTAVRIRSAAAPGGAVVAADPNIVLAESITDAADVWNVGAVNLNTLAGSAAGARQEAVATVAVTAAMISKGFRFDFLFTAVGFEMLVKTATGVLRSGVAADTFTVDNGGVLCTFAGGASPDVQATDVLVVRAWSAPV